MTDSPPPSRPQQVTSAVVLAVSACILAVVNVFSTRDALRGTALRDAIADAQGSVGLERNVELVVRLLELLVPVSGALAAAAAVLAVYAWQRHRAAWLGFFVLAGLLALTLPVAGVVPVLLLAAAVVFLASRPAREWYADRPAAVGPQLVLTQEEPRSDGPPPGPPAYGSPYGSGSGHGPGYPSAPPYASAHGQQPVPYAGAQPPGRDPDKRPGTVTAACVITWVGATLTALMLALTAVFLVSNGGRFTREFRRQVDESGLTVDDLLTILWGVVALGLLWCLAAVVVAVLAFRRHRGGRIALAVSAALTVLVSLVAILSFVSAVTLLMGIAVLVLLFTGGANDWYARRGGWAPPPGGPYGGQPYGQQYQQPYGQPPPPPERTGPW